MSGRDDMKQYKILITEQFEKDFNKLDNSLRQQIEREIEQLESNPYIGKPLGYTFLREKKIKNHRIYYLIYEQYVVVFVVAVSDKKDQQKAINAIKKLIPYYREKIKEKVNVQFSSRV